MAAYANILHRFALGNRMILAIPDHPRSGDHWAYIRQVITANFTECRIRRKADISQDEFSVWQSFCKLEG